MRMGLYTPVDTCILQWTRLWDNQHISLHSPCIIQFNFISSRLQKRNLFAKKNPPSLLTAFFSLLFPAACCLHPVVCYWLLTTPSTNCCGCYLRPVSQCWLLLMLCSLLLAAAHAPLSVAGSATHTLLPVAGCCSCSVICRWLQLIHCCLLPAAHQSDVNLC